MNFCNFSVGIMTTLGCTNTLITGSKSTDFTLPLD